MKSLRKFQCCLALIAVAVPLQSGSAFAVPISDYYCGFQVVGYYPDYWQTPVPDIRYDKVTDIVFFSIYPNSDGSLNLSQIDPDRQTDLITAAHANNVAVHICVGGWGLSEGFSEVAADTSLRKTFINHLTQHCLDHGFEGIVLDWEPVWADADRNHYTALIQELKTALAVHNRLLSVAVSALGGEFYPTAIDSIDRVQVMAYDMGTPHSTYEDAVAAVDHWEAYGFSRDTILLGLPFYGRDNEGTYYPYDMIIADYNPDPDIDVINGITFNGIETIQRKTRYSVNQGYLGVMIWELTEDTTDSHSLLTAIANTVHLNRGADFNCDGLADSRDLNYLASQWMQSDCQSDNSWCNAADLDHSGAVGLSDFVRFAYFWMNTAY